VNLFSSILKRDCHTTFQIFLYHPVWVKEQILEKYSDHPAGYLTLKIRQENRRLAENDQGIRKTSLLPPLRALHITVPVRREFPLSVLWLLGAAG
jgi:hypothetical protein